MQTNDLSADQVLHELERLAEVEHAMIIDHLLACCALGHDLEPAEGGATSPVGREAASTYFTLAMNEMFHFAAVNRALVAEGRSFTTTRATTVLSPSGGSMALCPVDLGTAQEMIDRHRAVARAVDALYARVRPALGVLHAETADILQSVVGEGATTHADAFGSIDEIVPTPIPGDLLRVTRRDATDGVEQRLLDASDRLYRIVISAWRGCIEQADAFAAGDLRQIAGTAMEALADVNRALVNRGLLPSFSAP
jgi:hypothetical protein